MITLAKNKDGKYVNSKEAKPGETHYCVHCSCALILKRSVLGKLYFSRKAGQIHRDSLCRKMGENPVTRELELTNSTEFHAHLLEPSNRGGGGSKLPGPPRETRLPEEHSLPVRSLEDLWNTGIALAETGKTANGDVSDILLCGKRATAAMHGNEPIGPYAIKVRPEYYFRGAQRIRFVFSFTEHNAIVGDNKYYKKILDLHFADTHEFEYYTKKLFRTERNSSDRGMGLKPKYDVVLIHGNWQSLSNTECKDVCRKQCTGKWKCSGYQYAEVVNSGRQIYCPSNRKIEE